MEGQGQERSLGKQISHISRDIRWMIQHELEPCGVGSGTHFFLHLIEQHPGITQNDLSGKTDIDKATAAKGLAKLEQQGYLQRIPDSEDGRVRRLYLTKAGKAIMPAIRATLRRVTEVCATDLSRKELDELFRLLDRVEAALGHYIGDRKNGLPEHTN